MEPTRGTRRKTKAPVWGRPTRGSRRIRNKEHREVEDPQETTGRHLAVVQRVRPVLLAPPLEAQHVLPQVLDVVRHAEPRKLADCKVTHVVDHLPRFAARRLAHVFGVDPRERMWKALKRQGRELQPPGLKRFPQQSVHTHLRRRPRHGEHGVQRHVQLLGAQDCAERGRVGHDGLGGEGRPCRREKGFEFRIGEDDLRPDLPGK